jgi:hypothetical protein
VIVAGAVAAIGLVILLAGSGQRTPTKAPSATPAPVRREMAPSKPEDVFLPMPSSLTPAEQTKAAAPVDTSPKNAPVAETSSTSTRKARAGAAEEGREHGKSTAATKVRPPSERRARAKAQPKKEIRGFNDF